MKNYYFILGLMILCWQGCSNEEEKLFSDTATIYFDLSDSQLEGIVYSFAKTTATEHVVEVPVEIAGYASDHDRKFLVKVDPERSTAVEGKHYKALEAYYTLPPGEFATSVPVTVMSEDRLLDSVEVCLTLQLLPEGDFVNRRSDRQEAEIRISNILQKPAIWDQVYGRKYFGPYSRTKYKLILEVCKIDELPAWGHANRYKLMGLGMAMQNYFTENYPVYDENGKIIEPNWTITY